MVDHAGRLLDHLLRSQIPDQPGGDVEVEPIEVDHMLNHRALLRRSKVDRPARLKHWNRPQLAPVEAVKPLNRAEARFQSR